MAITIDDFDKVWASQSPLTPYQFSESQYEEGWNFVGGTPPSRQMWDFLQKNNDEKMQYLANNYLPLSGGTLTGDVLGVTPPNGDNSKKIANTEFIQALANILVPIGCVQAFAGSTTPDGWLLCDGSAVSRTDYAELYSVIGDAYGDGDGSTTFNLPDLADKFIQGNAVAGTEHSAGLPNITGTLVSPANNGWSPSIDKGLFASTVATVNFRANLENFANGMSETQTFDASRANSIYGNSTTVQPPSVTMRFIIKY